VGHNPDAARVLAQNLESLPARGHSFAVLGMFKDKASGRKWRGARRPFDRWYLAGLEGPRGQKRSPCASACARPFPDAELAEYPTVTAAYAASAVGRSSRRPGRRFGSSRPSPPFLKISERRYTAGARRRPHPGVQHGDRY